MPLRIAFMGTPEFAAKTLGALVADGHEIACVYTRAPKPAGRGKREQKTPVHVLAEQLGLLVRTPGSLRDLDSQKEFAALEAQVGVVVAYGLILPAVVLDAPEYGCLNLHGSILPRWRGAAPIQRAIMAGDEITGVQVMQMDEGLDTGPVLLSETLPISASDTAGRLHDRMADTGADLMVRALSALERGSLAPTAQSQDGITYAHKIDKREARIDWSRPAQELDWHIRGLSPFPGAWFELNGKKKLRVKALRSELADGQGKPGEVLNEHLTIGTGTSAVRLTRVQPAGGKPQSGADFVRGHRIAPGTILT